MPLHLKVEPAADCVRNFANCAIVKLNDLVALIADQVVVVAFVEKNVMRRAGSLVDGANNSQFTEQFQRAIHRHPPDLRS